MSDWQDIATAQRNRDRRSGDMPVWSVTTGQWGVVRRGRFVPLTLVEPAPPRDADTRPETNDDHAVLPDSRVDPTTL